MAFSSSYQLRARGLVFICVALDTCALRFAYERTHHNARISRIADFYTAYQFRQGLQIATVHRAVDEVVGAEGATLTSLDG